MKKVLFLSFLVFTGTAILAQTSESENNKEETVSKDTRPGARITFKESKFDFGDIHQGDKVEHVFNFENNGTDPLILTDVRSTCGCTIPKWPKEPIPPGQSAKITVRFNSTGKMGKVNKVVKIVSNAVDPISQVTITTNILPKKEVN